MSGGQAYLTFRDKLTVSFNVANKQKNSGHFVMFRSMLCRAIPVGLLLDGTGRRQINAA